MSTIITPAIVLRVVNTGESDRVLTLLGRATGSIGAIARGARKSQRRFGGGLSLGSVGQATLRERAGAELLTLEGFEVADGHFAFASELRRMGEAAYVAELVTKLCAPRQAEPGIYDWTVAFLGLLDTWGATEERLRVFELGLLERLGFGPALHRCAICQRDDLSVGPHIDVRWDPERGGVVCLNCGARGRQMRPAVRLALATLAGVDLTTGAGDPAGTVAGQARLPDDVARGCRDALAELIAGHLSSPLRSLDFLAQISETPGTP